MPDDIETRLAMIRACLAETSRGQNWCTHVETYAFHDIPW